jgi:hypothetical protein
MCVGAGQALRNTASFICCAKDSLSKKPLSYCTPITRLGMKFAFFCSMLNLNFLGFPQLCALDRPWLVAWRLRGNLLSFITYSSTHLYTHEKEVSIHNFPHENEDILPFGYASFIAAPSFPSLVKILQLPRRTSTSTLVINAILAHYHIINDNTFGWLHGGDTFHS